MTTLPRFRIRTLMIAVAVVGLVLGGLRAYALWRLSDRYRRESDGYRVMARRALECLAEAGDGLTTTRALAAGARDKGRVRAFCDESSRYDESSAKWSRERFAYAEKLRARYERASAYRWIPVEPDAPEPGPPPQPRRSE